MGKAIQVLNIVWLGALRAACMLELIYVVILTNIQTLIKSKEKNSCTNSYFYPRAYNAFWKTVT